MSAQNHYDTLGLDRRCTTAQIRAAYRRLVKEHHPDVNHTAPEATRRVQALNTAHAALSDSVRRAEYDRELDGENPAGATVRGGKHRDIAQDVMLRIEEFFRGTALNIRVNDPANLQGAESYELEVPPDTAPGTKFRLLRAEEFSGSCVVVRLRVLRVPGEGLPKPRGGRGDLLVRVTYRVEVKITRGSKRPSSSSRRMLER